MTPDLRQAGFAEGELAVGIDAGAALAVEDFGPRRGIVGFGCFGGADEGGEDIEVVNFAEEILEALEVAAPGGMLHGEQSFGGVAETLESDAEFVPGPRFLGTKSAGMELTGGFEALEGKAFGGKSARRDETRTASEVAFEMSPLPAVKFAGSLKSVLREHPEFLLEIGVKADADGIALGTEAIDPFFHHLRIAELSQAAEEGFGGLPHAVPGAVGIDFGESGGEGAAATQGDAEVMHAFGIGMLEDAVEFLERAVHPMG